MTTLHLETGVADLERPGRDVRAVREQLGRGRRRSERATETPTL
jgi:hypothetical protein